MKTLLALAASTAMTFAAFGLQPAAVAAPAAAAAGGMCFYTQQLTSFRPDGLSTIYVGASGGRMMRIDLATDCNALGDPGGSLVVSPVNGAVCSPQGLDVGVDTGGVVERCMVKSIVRLSPEEAAALPARLRP